MPRSGELAQAIARLEPTGRAWIELDRICGCGCGLRMHLPWPNPSSARSGRPIGGCRRCPGCGGWHSPGEAAATMTDIELFGSDSGLAIAGSDVPSLGIMATAMEAAWFEQRDRWACQSPPIVAVFTAVYDSAREGRRILSGGHVTPVRIGLPRWAGQSNAAQVLQEAATRIAQAPKGALIGRAGPPEDRLALLCAGLGAWDAAAAGHPAIEVHSMVMVDLDGRRYQINRCACHDAVHQRMAGPDQQAASPAHAETLEALQAMRILLHLLHGMDEGDTS